jgi:hypothetical protein
MMTLCGWLGAEAVGVAQLEVNSASAAAQSIEVVVRIMGLPLQQRV